MNAIILAAAVAANLAVGEPSFPDDAAARQELLWQDYTNRQWQVYRNRLRAAKVRAKADDPVEREKRKLAELKREAEREQRRRAQDAKRREREEFLKSVREKREESRRNGGAK